MGKRIFTLILAATIAFSWTNFAFAKEDNTNFNIINDVSNFVEKNYKFGMTAERMKNEALCYMLQNNDTNIDNVLKAMFKLLDEHSTYFTKDEFEKFESAVTASMSGIGTGVMMTKAGVAVTDITKFSPAEKAGLKPFDIIVSADGETLVGKTIDEAANLIKGMAGTTVKIGVKRYGTEGVLYFDIVRGNVEQSTVYWEKISDDIAYLGISMLTLNCDVFVREALKEIDAAGIKKIVLDLRDNSGGYLDSTVNICSMFMPSGVAGYVDYKDPKKLETYYSTNDAPKYKLAVLINGATASGAEFLSGGLQDTGIGKVFGEQSYGKGTVQSTIPIVNGGAFKLTVAKYYTSGKQDVAKDHINPDVEISNSYKKLNEENLEFMDTESYIGIGTEGKNVLALEQRLNALGFLENADEKFDSDSMKAVQLCKATYGMEPSPLVDVEFLYYINNIEYDRLYVTIDRQLEAAVEYLKGI